MSPLSIPTASSALDLRARLDAFRKEVVFTVTEIDLNKVDADALEADRDNSNRKLWRQDPATGNLGRLDNLFFQVKAVEVRPKGVTHPVRYFQPIFYEAPPPATVVIVCDRQTGDVLLDMKVEVGTGSQRNYTTLGTSLQVSSSRVELAKTTNKEDPALPMLSVLVGLGVFDAPAVKVAEDPNRFFEKCNENRVVFVDSKAAVDAGASASMLWVKLDDFYEETNVNEANGFLWELLGLLVREQRREARKSALA